jgi:hypothetical protein
VAVYPMSLPPKVKVTREVSEVTASICGGFVPCDVVRTFAVVAPEHETSTSQPPGSDSCGWTGYRRRPIVSGCLAQRRMSSQERRILPRLQNEQRWLRSSNSTHRKCKLLPGQQCRRVKAQPSIVKSSCFSRYRSPDQDDHTNGPARPTPLRGGNDADPIGFVVAGRDPQSCRSGSPRSDTQNVADQRTL